MTSLFLILLCLFVTLAVVVKIAERYGKPMEPEESQKLSKIIMILVGILLLVTAFKTFL